VVGGSEQNGQGGAPISEKDAKIIIEYLSNSHGNGK
jgi:hypothetical protein